MGGRGEIHPIILLGQLFRLALSLCGKAECALHAAGDPAHCAANGASDGTPDRPRCLVALPSSLAGAFFSATDYPLSVSHDRHRKTNSQHSNEYQSRVHVRLLYMEEIIRSSEARLRDFSK
jgi:hypothetical protein